MSADVIPFCGVDLREESGPYVPSAVFSQEGALGPPDMLSRVLRERYRCPGEFLRFAEYGEPSGDAGYFRFGSDVVCYGRSCVGGVQSQLSSSLFDLADHGVVKDGTVRLPFDPDEVIDNLRLERYPLCRSSGYGNVLKRIYYWLRPLTNQSLRKKIKQFHFRNWQSWPFPRWPVDTTVENLCETLLALSLRATGVDKIPFVWFWPRGARGGLMMTHDVETEAGRDFCRQLLEIDESFGIKASFQIVPQGRYGVPSTLLDVIRARGFEIGVQDLNHDGRLFDDRGEFQRRVALINRYGRDYAAKGFRAAVLYRQPEWYQDLEFSFDMSIPNVAHLDPQRGGCCTVMPYFIGEILELPVTTVQDYTLFHLLNEPSIALWRTQVELILEKHGLASFIVHPDYIQERDTRSVYENLLGYLRDLGEKTPLWVALPRDIDSWWRARSQMSVIGDGDSWRIEGAGAEHAVLAFAKNVNGKLVYDVTEAPSTSAQGRSA
ncbi:MAG TPA: hypothetical protein VEK84_04865 [Terriglobales bacterium]|nr:hypothetical protein [Terriglobales bacterium]